MMLEQYESCDAAASHATTLTCTKRSVWIWPGIPLTEQRGDFIRPRPGDQVANLVAMLHGPDAVHCGLNLLIERTAAHLTAGRLLFAQQTLQRFSIPSVTSDGWSLISKVAQLLMIPAPRFTVRSSPRLWTDANVTAFARVFADQAFSYDDPELDFDPNGPNRHPTLLYTGLTKAGFNPSEPRDERGRWTGADSSEATQQTSIRIPFQTVPANPPQRTPRRRNPFVQYVADEDNDTRNGAAEETLDPMAGLRVTLYGIYRRELRDIDPYNPALESIQSPDWIPSDSDINNMSYTRDVARYTKLYEAAPDLPTTPWEAAAVTRGEQIHEIRGQTLPHTFPVIDSFENGVATSIKSIDLNAQSYQDPARLEGRINAYVNKLRDYNGTKWKTIEVLPQNIKTRLLDLVIPKGAGTSAQLDVIERTRRRAWNLGIAMDLTPY